MNLFHPGNHNQIFKYGYITDGLMRAFKGKWGSGLGEEKSGVLQPLSRLSYLDFLSHCRRVVLNFDTSMKLPAPRFLHTSQYGFFCTSETPSGASIGITKNLTVLTMISIGTEPSTFVEWLFNRAGLEKCADIPTDTLQAYVPFFLNGGILGFYPSYKAKLLVQVLKMMKWTGCLSAFASICFNYTEHCIQVYLDDGRPMRPLIRITNGAFPVERLRAAKTWKELVLGNAAQTDVFTTGFLDPLADLTKPPALEAYIERLQPHQGVIEYVDPYEQNELFLVSFPEHITAETTHMEIHPSTIVSIITAMIPFANHNQSPRNQLSCSQSKQGLSLYATNYQNRYDNTANILSYGQAPLVRTLYYDFLGEGNMPYGHNIFLALGCYSGYNRDDGILINGDSLQRGLFRNINYRSYETFEENDMKVKTKTRIAHPRDIVQWTALKTGHDYRKLDKRGIIRVGELVDENTILVGRYTQAENGSITDASLTPQVWTFGRVESVVITLNNTGLQLVKIRITQDRIPELGDKFSNRHGQKGTIGMILRSYDMPRTASGLVPDMIMNPHAIPSRMTVAQLLETLLGKVAAQTCSIGDGTIFMNEGDPTETIGSILQSQYGFEKYGNEYMYNGETGTMIPTYLFVGPVYTMRLRHMVADKWNARGEGRRERKTHQPTGGRGNQGGLRIGEMERDALLGHGIASFTKETYTKRSDGSTLVVCNGCGNIPVYNSRENLYICPMCEGPVQYIGETANNLDILPPVKRSTTTFSKIEIPFSTKILNDELQTYMNIGMRYITGKYANRLSAPEAFEKLSLEDARKRAGEPLPERVVPESHVPELAAATAAVTVSVEDLKALGVEKEDEIHETVEDGTILPSAAPTSAPPMSAPQAVLITPLTPLPAAAPAAATVPTPVLVAPPAVPVAPAPIPVIAPQPIAAAPAPVPVAPPAVPAAPAPVPVAPPAVPAAPIPVAPPAVPAAPAPSAPLTYPSQPQALYQQPSLPAILQLQQGGTLLPAGYSLPPTIVVDTSSAAMEADGFYYAQSQQPPRSRSPARPRSASGGGGGGGAPRAQSSYTPQTRVTIIKEGST